MRSPEYVQMSTAAAITLGLVAGRMHRTQCTHCLNLLVTYPEGCRANCAYCGLARHREEARDYADRNFIRVDWPTACYDEVIERVKAGDDKGRFERMCISMITHPNSNDDTFVLLEKVGARGARRSSPIQLRSKDRIWCACATRARTSFDEEGRVADFGLTSEELEPIIASGKPLRTSGCPGKEDDVSACNRPYGDSSPSDILSFRFAPAKRDIDKIRRQMQGDEVKASRQSAAGTLSSSSTLIYSCF